MNKRGKHVHDVIIIGAGPVGSFTAYLLARKGFDVGIFEKKPVVGQDVNCTGIVSRECFERFSLPEDPVINPVHAIRAVSPSGEYLRYHSASPLAYTLDRSRFDMEMHGMAERSGVVSYLNAQVKEIEGNPGGFSVLVNHGGERVHYRSEVGIIATGFDLHSFQKIYKRRMQFMYGIQTHARMQGVQDVEVYFGRNIAPGSFGWVVPIKDQATKVGLIVGDRPAEHLRRFLGCRFISERLIEENQRFQCSPIPMKRIPKSYAERILVVGEAAGQVKTTTGGGIYFGLLCAQIASETVSRAFSLNDYREGIFQEYESRWKKKIAPELKAGKLIRNVFGKLSDRQIDFLMNIAKQDGIMPVIKNADFDWHRDIVTYILRHLLTKRLFPC